MRGGVSMRGKLYPDLIPSSPHAWGCFHLTTCHTSTPLVFPTCVGVFLKNPRNAVRRSGLPHMRGGVSSFTPIKGVTEMSCPHAWGCFFYFDVPQVPAPVFPTCVGVFPIFTGISASTLGLPHMRGGVSELIASLETAGESSPHAWGCFYSMTIDSTHQFVFPTCVGVFPRHLQTVYLWSGLPHMRGGVSCFIRSDGSISASSPHAWGCFFSNVIDGF